MTTDDIADREALAHEFMSGSTAVSSWSNEAGRAIALLRSRGWLSGAEVHCLVTQHERIEVDQQADIDTWRQRAEKAESEAAHLMTECERLVNTAYDGWIHPEEMARIRNDRDRLSRERDEASNSLVVVSTAMVATRDKLAIAVKALEELRDHGCRHDTTPTLVEPWDTVRWYSYIRSMNEGVKATARKALEEINLPGVSVGCTGGSLPQALVEVQHPRPFVATKPDEKGKA